MKAWSTWYPDLIPHVPGCPLVVAQHELRRAAQAFFGATRAWKVIEPALAVSASQSSVTASPSDSGQELVRVESVHYDRNELKLEAMADMSAKYGTGWASQTGTPSAYLLITPGEIRLYPIPDADATIGVERVLSVRPSEAATGLPDDLATKYRDEIQVGAKARLMLMPGKPWTNIDIGAAMGQAFDALTGTGNLNAALSYGNGRISSRSHWC